MIGRLLKGFAYLKAPVKTFAALHPLRFAKYAAFLWVGKKVWARFTNGERRTSRPATPSGSPAAASGPGGEMG